MVVFGLGDLFGIPMYNLSIFEHHTRTGVSMSKQRNMRMVDTSCSRRPLLR